MKIVGCDPSINSSGIYMMELDDKTLDIIDQDYMGFTQVKKNSSDKIYHYKKKDFKNNIDQYIWMINHIMSFINFPDYVAIEGYAYAATGRVFEIGEFCGLIKYRIYRQGIKMRILEPTVVKLYATGKGNVDKIHMCDEYEKYNDGQINLDTLPQYKTKEDIVDAYYICKLLRLELMLRRGLILLEQLTETEIRIFNRCTKQNPENILSRGFIGKQGE